MPSHDLDTIAAVATPAGRGGVGILRISGPLAKTIGMRICGRVLPGRRAVLAGFRDIGNRVVDQGIGIFFPAPGSYTGEPTVELHAHGSPVVLDLLLACCVDLGARLAQPGEFTERAFLNGKLDLTQAEAVADLIASTNAVQATLAARTLSGALGKEIHCLADRVKNHRVQVEADLDFSEEELDVAHPDQLHLEIDVTLDELERIIGLSAQGERFRSGIRVVIAGPPNAGKSSLLNALCGEDAAIVSAMPGTTRDPISVSFNLNGLPVHLVDTAGLRESRDEVEREGVRRAWASIAQADLVLWVYDALAGSQSERDELVGLLEDNAVTMVRNKIDLLGEDAGLSSCDRFGRSLPELSVSATADLGVDRLKAHIGDVFAQGPPSEAAFIARRRHLEALDQARKHLLEARQYVKAANMIEFVAEELRLALLALGKITGKYTTDDLLGEIFSTFCIGK